MIWEDAYESVRGSPNSRLIRRSTELTLDTLERKLSLVAPRLARRRGRGFDVVLSLAHDGVGGTRICRGGWVDGNRIKSDRSERGRGFQS